MNTPHVTTIKLPVARAEQLKTLAALHGLSVTEFLEDVINRAIADEILPDTLPGFPVRVVDGHVVVTIGDRQLPPLTAKQALVLALHIAKVECSGAPTGGEVTVGDAVLQIARVGRGMVLRPKGEDGGAMTRGMARDLSRQILYAAVQIKKTELA